MTKEKVKVSGLSVRTKLIASFFLVLLVPSLVIGLISYQSAKNKVSTEMLKNASGNVQVINKMIDQIISQKENDVNFLASSVKTQNEAVAWDALSQYQTTHSDALNAYVGTDAGKMILAPKQSLPSDYDPRTRDWYKQAMQNKGNIIITSPYADAVSGTIEITIAKTASDGKSVAAIDVNLTDLAKTVKDIKIGNNGYAIILDKSGRNAIVDPDAKPGQDVGAWAQGMYGSSDSGQYTYDYKGQPKQLAYYTNKLTGWKIAGTLYTNEFASEAQSIRNVTLLVIVISVLLGAILVFLQIRAITKPLRLVIEASKKIGQGDFSQQVAIKARDEFGALGTSFNQMVDSLRTVLTEVEQSAVQLAASSEELTASASQSAQASEHTAQTMQALAEGTDKQVRMIDQSDHTVKELTQGINQIALRAQTVTETAVQASEIAKEGNGSIQKVMQQMQSIHERVNVTADNIQNLHEHAQHIGEIVDTITGIASQTNLLALNAAIEAARAGENGRGFAVVADEVRKLAEQSSNSALQITEYVGTIQEEIRNAVQAMEQGTTEVTLGIDVVNAAGTSFHKIQGAVGEVNSQIQEVSAAVQQMSAGAEEVARTVEMMKEVTESTAAGTQTVSASSEEQLASMEEIAASANSLSQMAEQLDVLIKNFKR